MDVDVKPVLEAGYGVKALKTWRTDDGGGYQFNLTFGGKVVAEVTQGGHGGETELRWEDGTYPNGTPMPGLTAKAKAVAKVAAEARERLDAIAKASPPVESRYGDGPLTVDVAWLMSALLDHVENAKRLAKLCKRMTLFTVPGDAEGEGYRTVKMPFDARVKAYIMDKYPGAVILNETIGGGV